MINKLALVMSIMWLIGCSIISVMLTISVFMNIVTYSDIVMSVAYICICVPVELLISTMPLMMWLDANGHL